MRANPAGLLDGCQTVISLAYPYSSKRPCTPDGFHVARYAEPRKEDYHDRLRKVVKRFIQSIVAWYPESRTRICVDSAPILERSFAYASGMGFIGKNNMLIVPGYGSYLFLVEILTTAVLPLSTNQPMDAQCGSCDLCLESCPTGALEGPFSLDASKCLSYLTIEYGGRVDRGTGRKMSRCFFGCDICQEVCPFNAGGSSRDICLPSTDRILAMGAEDFEGTLGKTALARPGLEKVQGNIMAARPVS